MHQNSPDKYSAYVYMWSFLPVAGFMTRFWAYMKLIMVFLFLWVINFPEDRVVEYDDPPVIQ